MRPRRAKQLKISSPPWKPPTATSLPVRTRARPRRAAARATRRRRRWTPLARGRSSARRRSQGGGRRVGRRSRGGLESARRHARGKGRGPRYRARKEAALAAAQRRPAPAAPPEEERPAPPTVEAPRAPSPEPEPEAASPTKSEGYFDAHGYEAPPTDSPVRYVEAAVKADSVARAITLAVAELLGAPDASSIADTVAKAANVSHEQAASKALELLKPLTISEETDEEDVDEPPVSRERRRLRDAPRFILDDDCPTLADAAGDLGRLGVERRTYLELQDKVDDPRVDARLEAIDAFEGRNPREHVQLVRRIVSGVSARECAVSEESPSHGRLAERGARLFV